MKISNNYILKKVADSYLVVPVGKEAINFNAIIHLNEVGAFIFSSLQDNDLTIEEVASKLENEYEVTYAQALEDTNAFITKLKEKNIL